MSDKPQKKRREEGIVREREREKVAWKKEKEGEGKKNNTLYRDILQPGLFLSDKFKRSLSPLLFPSHFLLTLSTVSALHHLPF